MPAPHFPPPPPWTDKDRSEQAAVLGY